VSPIYAPHVHLATTIAAIGWPEDGLTKSQAENLFLAGAIICVIAILFVLRQFKTGTSRVLWVSILLVLTGLMVWQRVELQDCAGQCSCELLGRDLAIEDEDAFCPDP
jgi:hypothetical protein